MLLDVVRELLCEDETILKLNNENNIGLTRGSYGGNNKETKIPGSASHFDKM